MKPLLTLACFTLCLLAADVGTPRSTIHLTPATNETWRVELEPSGISFTTTNNLSLKDFTLLLERAERFLEVKANVVAAPPTPTLRSTTTTFNFTPALLMTNSGPALPGGHTNGNTWGEYQERIRKAQMEGKRRSE